MMTYQGVSSLIEALGSIRERPGLYIGDTENVLLVQLWLFGMLDACNALNYRYSLLLELDVLERHGLERASDGVLEQLRARGLSEEAITYRLIDLEIEKWERVRSELSE